MPTTSPPKNFGTPADTRFDLFSSVIPSAPSNAHSPQQLGRHCSPNRSLGTPLSASASSRSSVVAPFPLAGATSETATLKSTHQHIISSGSGINNNNGHSPLLPASPLLSVKSYGTASDIGDDISAKSAVVGARSSVATTGSTARSTANNTPCSLEDASWKGNQPTHSWGYDTTGDAAVSVNDFLLAGGKSTDYASPTFPVPTKSCGDRVAAAAAATGFTLHSSLPSHIPTREEENAEKRTEATSNAAGLASSYDPHTIDTNYLRNRIMKREDVLGNGGDGEAGKARKGLSSTKFGQASSTEGTSGRPGHFGYTNLKNNDHNEDDNNSHEAPPENNGDDGRPDSGGGGFFFSPASASPPPTFTELVLRRVHTTSLLQFLWVVLLVVMLMVGNACQVIFLNFWIHQFPPKNNPPSYALSSSRNNDGSGSSSGKPDRVEALESSYTTFIISATLFSAFFIAIFAVYWLWRRPNLSFVRERAGWLLLLGIGAMDTLNSAMAIYAAAHTPEVLQALFVSLVPIYSAFFTKWLLKDPRNYANVYVVVSFALIMAGVALASLFSYAAAKHHRRQSDDNGGVGSARHGFVAMHTPTFLFNFFSPDSAASAATRDKQIWCLIFFFSVPPTVLLNVFQTMYMIRYTHSDDMTAYLMAHEGEAEESTVRTSVIRSGSARIEVEEDREEIEEKGKKSNHHGSTRGSQQQPERAEAHPSSVPDAQPAVAAPLLASGSSSSRSSVAATGSDSVQTSIQHQHRLHVPSSQLLLHGEDTTVKLVMLAADTTLQALMSFMLMPMDALPWFGGSDSIQEAWRNLDDGIDCVLHCPRNMRYCMLYSMGFVLVYIAAAYLNRYSVTLCSMVSQLSGPITALLLIAFPSLNVTGDSAPWYISVFAVVLLSLGTVIYVYWDEVTCEEKASGEMQLKWAMMEEQARRRRSVEADDDDNDAEGGPRQPSASASSVAATGVAATGLADEAENEPQQSHRRHSRSRRFRRRRESSYVVVVDHDPDAPPRRPHPAGAAAPNH